MGSQICSSGVKCWPLPHLLPPLLSVPLLRPHPSSILASILISTTYLWRFVTASCKVATQPRWQNVPLCTHLLLAPLHLSRIVNLECHDLNIMFCTVYDCLKVSPKQEIPDLWDAVFSFASWYNVLRFVLPSSSDKVGSSLKFTHSYNHSTSWSLQL